MGTIVKIRRDHVLQRGTGDAVTYNQISALESGCTTRMVSRIGSLIQQIGYTTWYGAFKRSYFRPTFAIDSFNELEVPSNIEYIILDKDNCFAKPHATSVWPAYSDRWAKLMAQHKQKYEVCVLSNTAGDATDDPNGELARLLEKETGATVLRHQLKKPMCYQEVADSLPCKPDNVLVVGDRLMTDVLLANLIGAQSVWIRPGSHPSFFNHLEMTLASKNGKP